jgi:hypothetical protein
MAKYYGIADCSVGDWKWNMAIANDWVASWQTNTSTATSASYPMVVSGTWSQPPPPVRAPAPLEFSPYINGAELVLEFLAEARARVPGLTREQFLAFTIGDFFAFLLRRAAEVDGVPPPEAEELQALR